MVLSQPHDGGFKTTEGAGRFFSFAQAASLAAEPLSEGMLFMATARDGAAVYGEGKPYFGTLANGHVMLEDPEVVIQGDGVLHLRYPVHR